MPTPSPSRSTLEAAAKVAKETGCVIELPAKGGVVRILPPGLLPPQNVNPADLVDMRE
jgi:hypothetical protein